MQFIKQIIKQAKIVIYVAMYDLEQKTMQFSRAKLHI